MTVGLGEMTHNDLSILALEVEDTGVITSVIYKSGAWNLNVAPGWRIVEIDGEPFSKSKLDEEVANLPSSKMTSLKLDTTGGVEECQNWGFRGVSETDDIEGPWRWSAVHVKVEERCKQAVVGFDMVNWGVECNSGDRNLGTKATMRECA